MKDPAHPPYVCRIQDWVRGSRCPACKAEKSGARRHAASIAAGNSIAVVDPELANELRNADPNDIAAGSQKYHDWECGCGAIYSSRPADRVYQAVDCCPKCRKKRHKSRGEVAVYAELAQFFSGCVLGFVVADESWDIAIPELKFVVEYDGYRWHSGKITKDRDLSPEAAERKRLAEDAEKSARLLSAGWSLLRLRENPLPTLGVPGVEEIYFDTIRQTEFRTVISSLATKVADLKLRSKTVSIDVRVNRRAREVLIRFSREANKVDGQVKRYLPARLSPAQRGYAKYIVATREGTDQLRNRQNRDDILRPVLEVVFRKRKSSRRLFDRALKQELWHRSKPWGGKIRCPNPNGNRHCFGRMTFDECEVDHRTAYARGGPTELPNAQLLCRSCNRSKGIRRLSRR